MNPTSGDQCNAPKDGDPLPDHYQIVRLPNRPGQEEFDFKPKPSESTIHVVNSTGKKAEGFSVLGPPSDKDNPLKPLEAGQAGKDEFKNAFKVNKKQVFTVSAKDLRDNGFDVIKDSTKSLPSHATIIKKGGGAWSPEDSGKLAKLFGTQKVK